MNESRFLQSFLSSYVDLWLSKYLCFISRGNVEAVKWQWLNQWWEASKAAVESWNLQGESIRKFAHKMSSRYDKCHLARKDSVVFILALRSHFYLAGKKFNYRRIWVVERRKILLVVSSNRFDIFHRLREEFSHEDGSEGWYKSETSFSNWLHCVLRWWAIFWFNNWWRKWINSRR